MAWTATVTQKSVNNGMMNVGIQFTDGTKTVIENYRSSFPTEEWLKRTVRDRITYLSALDSFDATIGIGTVTPLGPDPVTPDEQNLFMNRVRLLGLVKMMIDMGVITQNNAKVTALVNWLKDRIATYFDLLG